MASTSPSAPPQPPPPLPLPHAREPNHMDGLTHTLGRGLFVVFECLLVVWRVEFLANTCEAGDVVSNVPSLTRLPTHMRSGIETVNPLHRRRFCTRPALFCGPWARLDQTCSSWQLCEQRGGRPVTASTDKSCLRARRAASGSVRERARGVLQRSVASSARGRAATAPPAHLVHRLLQHHDRTVHLLLLRRRERRPCAVSIPPVAGATVSWEVVPLTPPPPYGGH